MYTQLTLVGLNLSQLRIVRCHGIQILFSLSIATIFVGHYRFSFRSLWAGVVVSTAAFHTRVWSSVPGLGGLKKKQKIFLLHPRVKVSIVGSLRDREVACPGSDRQGSNFGSCVLRTVSSQSSHHPHEVLLVQFSLYVYKGGIKPDSFHLQITVVPRTNTI